MGRVRVEPSEGRGEGEARGEGRIVGRGHIYGVAGVVFAVAGGRDEAKDILERTTGGEEERLRLSLDTLLVVNDLIDRSLGLIREAATLRVIDGQPEGTVHVGECGGHDGPQP